MSGKFAGYGIAESGRGHPEESLPQGSGEDTVQEILPERENRAPRATDFADIQETLPESSKDYHATNEAGEKFGRGKVVESLPQPNGVAPKATDEAGDLFNVSGRTVRDAHDAP